MSVKSKKVTTGKTEEAAPRKRRSPRKESTPLMTTFASESFASASTRTRRNKSSTITERTDRYKHIDSGLVPYRYSYGTANKSSVSVRDAVVLCQKAYYNFSIFRNTIDLMTEFSVSDVYYQGGSKKSRTFFEALFKKLNIWNLMDKFFREYYRSGNVFLYRFDANLQSKDVKKISQTFGASNGEVDVPYKYIVLNPADIQINGALSFSSEGMRYFKILSDYELDRLKNPQTEEDQKIFEALDPETKKLLRNKSLNFLRLPLDGEKVSAVFYKKQDYEPFSVPMGFPVLEDINHKAELKKMDMAIARTVQQAVLLVTMGNEPDKGGINQKNLIEMQKLFENQSVGRVLIADYTTKAQFVVPQISDLLDPKKYETVNSDINAGLNNILTGVGGSGERFANHQAKVEVFIARLRQARKAFLNDFLIPEIKRISKVIGLRNYPTPAFDEIELRDNTQKYRVYTRLAELGILTPEELLEAIGKNRLPDPEVSLDAQKEYMDLRNEGLYSPLVGGPSNTDNPAMEKWVPEEVAHPELQKQNTPTSPKKPKQPKKNNTTNTGRPPGSKSPQSTKTVSPVGVNSSEKKFSANSVMENFTLASKLEKELGSWLRKKHNVKRLNKKQKEVGESIARIIIANESPENWMGSIEMYCKDPTDTNDKQIGEIQDIALEHQIDSFVASILFHSKD